jgi:hypothetical protein
MGGPIREGIREPLYLNIEIGNRIMGVSAMTMAKVAVTTCRLAVVLLAYFSILSATTAVRRSKG